MNLPLFLKTVRTHVRNLIITVIVLLGLQGCGLGSDNTNIHPIASAGNQVERLLSDANPNGNIVIQLRGAGQDNGGRITQYLWEIIAFEGDDIDLIKRVVIAQADQAETTFTVPAIDASYTLRLTVTDDAGDSDSDILQVLIGRYANPTPNVRTGIVSAGANQTVTSGDRVTLEASAENFIGELSYEWRRISQSGLGTNLTNYKARIASFTAPDVFVTQEFVIQVRVSAQNEEKTSQTTITVNPKPASAINNKKPTANAGVDQLALPGATVKLKGLGSDTDGIIASYNWTQISENTIVVDMLGSDTANMSFVAPNVDTLTILRFSLQVYDDDNEFAADEVFVSINPNPPTPVNRAPFARAGASKTVVENVLVTLTGSGSTDTDGTIDSYAWLQIGGPAVVLQTANRAVSSFTSPVFGQNTDLTFQLTVTDNLGATGVDTSVVTVTPNTQNVPPTANAGANFSVPEGNIVTVTGTGADPDGSIKSYLWSVLPGGINLTLQSANTNTVKFVAPSVTQPTQVSLQLQVTDNRDASTTSVVIITIDPIPNALPVANAGINQSVNSASSVTLNGSGTDSDGSIVAYQWNVISGPAITLLSATTASTSFLAPTVSQTSEIVLELVVTDNRVAKGSDTVIITINPINALPVANAGPDQSVASGSLVNLSGSGSDSDGTVTFEWSQTQGPTVGLANSLAANTSFTAPNVTQNSDIILRLTVTDNLGATQADVVIITVLAANVPPVANAGANQTVTSGDPVIIDGSGSTDSDGTIVSYLWSQVSGPALTLDATNNNAPSLSFPAPSLTATNTITLKLTVTDNRGDSANDLIDIIVNPANQPPTANAGPDIAAFSGEQISITGAGTDIDGTIVSYRWIYVSGPTVVLNNASTATVTFTAAPVTQPSPLVLELTVTDNKNATTSDRVVINISPPTNIPPVANAGVDFTAASGSPVSITGSGTDIDGTIASYRWTQTAGRAVVLAGANTATVSFTAPTVTIDTPISLQLTVTDNQQLTSRSDPIVVTITATPTTNIAPVATIANANRTAVSGTTVSITGSGSDSDGTIVSYNWIEFGGATLTLLTATTPTVSFVAPTVSAATTFTLQLTVTDNQQAVGNALVTINVSPPAPNNILPVANAGLDKTVNEGTTVVINGVATDADGTISNTNWTQTSGPTVTLVNANTNNISFVAPSVLVQSIVVLAFTVTDNNGGTNTDVLNITVNPVNNPPVANAGADIIAQEQTPITLSGSASNDADGTISSYVWLQIQGPVIVLNTANQVQATFTAPAVTQTTVLGFRLTVTDNSNTRAIDTVLVTINPNNILPTANAGVDQTVTQADTVLLTGGGTDNDGTLTGFLWTQISATPGTPPTPVVSLISANTKDASFVAPAVTQQTSVTLQLTVTDNAGGTATDRMIVTINPGNIPPIANAGPAINTNNATRVTLSGAASSDPDGTILAYRWSQFGSLPLVTLSTPNAVTTQFTTPVVSSPSSLFFNLTVTDNLDATSNTSSVVVTVYPPSTLSGRITTSPSNMVDLDVNDTNTTPVSNNGIIAAQHIGNPGVLGGYVNLPRRGSAGNSFTGGDPVDVYHVTLNANQSIAVYVGNPITGVNEIGLELLDPTGLVVTASMSGTAIESVVAVAAGDYFIRVSAQAGASNYLMTLGAAPLQVQSNGWTLTDDFIPGEVIVEFKNTGTTQKNTLSFKANEVGLQAKAGAAGRSMLLGINKGNKSLAFSRLAVTNLNRKSQDNALQGKLDTLIAAAALRQRADVLSVRLNYRVYASAIPNDPNYNLQWHYSNINLPQAWDITTGSSNVIVAVVDSGVLLDHPDLIQAGKLVAGYDFIANDANSNDGQPGIDPDPYDVGNGGGGTVSSSFHGTHVAGTIAASSNNGIGVAGVAWGVKIMPIRVIGINGGSSYDVEQGIRYAAGLSNDSGTVPSQKADIINLSLGGPANTTTAPPAYSQARAANVIVIAAAGNNSTSAPSAPAAYTGVVSVSATDISKQLASYSNFGNTIDVAAPGGSSGDLNGDGFPDRVFSTGGNDTSGTIQFNYNLKMGTSMAAPHVAGVAALMKSIYPAMTPTDFDNMLARGDLTQDLGPVGRDNSFGYGLIDASKAVLAAQAASGVVIPPVQPPILSVTPTVLNYGVGLVGSDIVVQNIGAGSLSILSLTNDSGGWLSISPKLVNTSGLGTYTLTVNRIGLVDGLYNSIVTVRSNNGTVTVAVSMAASSHNLLSNAGPQIIELLDANTLNRVDIVNIQPVNGIYLYSFPSVPIGRYTIRSGSDLDNDTLLCELGESCGAYPILDAVGANIINVDGNIQNIINLDFETGFKSTLPVQ